MESHTWILTHTEHFPVVSLYLQCISFILCLGPDPADPNRLLIRKIVQLREGNYAYEETTISKSNDKEDPAPRVHTTLSKVGNSFDLQEHVTNEENAMRTMYRPMPNVIGFSLYSRET